MIVKNLNGTADNGCKCTSWLAHWKKFSGNSVSTCTVKGCAGTDLVGGHVQKDSTTDRAWYIIPICRACNGKKGQDLDIRAGTTLVSANANSTELGTRFL